MKKKILSVLLVAMLSLSLVACGDNEEKKIDDNEKTEELSDLDAIGDVEVDENLFTVELRIPAEFVGDATQEELDKTAAENDFKSITLNEDGSATYVMTKKQHKEMMSKTADDINTSLCEMIQSEDYPNFTDIKANEDFTRFTITTTSTELDMTESFSVLAFYTYGGMYNIFNGTPVDNVHVDFVNADSGEIIYSSDSSDME